MDLKVILIGPIGAGKSTLSRLVAQRLGLPCRHMDQVRTRYYKEIGYDEELAQQIHDREGFLGVYRYWKPFEAHAVERLLSEGGDAVVDFGGGHSVYEDDVLFSRVERVLAPYPYVILILPSPDKEESIRVLKERKGKVVSSGFDFHEHFVRHHSNYDLAKHVVYTKGKSPAETCVEIEEIVRGGEAAANNQMKPTPNRQAL
jgi:shikimate kinase